MEESFFLKYLNTIKKQKNSKEEIIVYIKEQTGIEIEEISITLSKKQIVFQVSSVVKQKLHQKNITKALESKGYQVRM